MNVHGESHPILNHVTISDNNGNGLRTSSPITMNHVTIVGNTTGAFVNWMNDESTMTNSIFWDNGPEAIGADYGDGFVVSYSDIEGGWDGEGNIDANPLFTDANNGDFTLQVGSPCIDAGTAFFEWEGDTLVNLNPDEYYGNAPDMGAFEWYPEDSEFELGDFNADGSINVLDVVALVANILSAGEFNPAGDLIEDGELNVLDIVALVNIILGGG